MDTLFEPRSSFANQLFLTYPSFVPTQSLYLDLEGRKSGSEDILNIYWPVLSGVARFAWIRWSEKTPITLETFNSTVESLRAEDAKSIVVFSAGREEPDERTRLFDLLGENTFTDREWVNLHLVVQQSRNLKLSIREHRNVWYHTDRSRVRYSLEALEWEFGIERPKHIRSHSNCYRDLAGGSGDMEVLSVIRRTKDGTASDEEEAALREYCEADVKNMFRVATMSERLAFSKSERRLRRSSA